MRARLLPRACVVFICALPGAPAFAQDAEAPKSKAPQDRAEDQGSAQAKKAPATVAVPQDRLEGFNSILPADCKEWLTVLSSDEFAGRATGRPGYEKAARYVADHFKSLGLEPMGDDGSYFQAVPFELTAPDVEASWISIQDADGKEVQRLAFGKDFAGQIAANSDKVFDLVFVTAKDSAIFGEAGKVAGMPSITGKAVIFVDRSDARQRGFSRTTSALYRSNPGALIVVDDDLAKAPIDALGRVQFAGKGPGSQRQARQMPNRYGISRATAKALLQQFGAAADLLDTETDGIHAITAKVHTHVAMKAQPVFGANVVAKLTGSDPELRDEYVGIGSH
ncbi:MAG TPA: hypothetical protein PKE00_15800, partial [Planctomycetota bacterium]|nr:hypothetical protein [Planctomycetota bacterium]